MRFLKKKEETYEPIESLIYGGEDYHIYYMTAKDRAVAGLMGIGVGTVVSWLFFKSIVVTMIAAAAVAVLAQGIYQESRQKKGKRNFFCNLKICWNR